MTRLAPLPSQDPGVPWPTAEWPRGAAPPSLDAAIDAAFDPAAPWASTHALAIVHEGRLVAERYVEGSGPDTTFPSWSMAKSVLHAAVGIATCDGALDAARPLQVPEWASPGDPRSAITLDTMLAMRDGLAFREDYDPEARSDVVEMLFGDGRDDVAHFAADRDLAVEPDTRFNYSSGTSNIVSRSLGSAVGAAGADAIESWLRHRLLDPIGMRTARPRFDAAGTWIASTYLYATARDFARFGLLFLRDGMWDGERVLPEGWVDEGRVPVSFDEEDDRWYGRHWWTDRDPRGTFWAGGYQGQRIWVVPAQDLVIVRLGETPNDLTHHLTELGALILDAFAARA